MEEACDQYKKAYTVEDSKVMLWEKLRPHIQEKISPVILNMAKAEGHEVLYSPPHYSNLQPIETVWAIVKGDVGRQYTNTTTFTDVLQRLNSAFDKVQPQTVQGCINKANRTLNKFYNDMKLEEEENNNDSISDSEDEADDSDNY